MKRQNQSSVAEFILLGFSNFPELQEQLFGVFLVVYLVTLLGNVIIIVIISLEQSLHVPMYLFLQNLSVVEMPSATGRQKAFSTCASHLTSVTLFYGTANMTYLQPKSGYSPETKKLMSLSYSLLTPLLNPLIYSLRNSEMKKALMKLWHRKVDSHLL
ncbi:olfactory receptor 10A3-like isoform X2 [Mustela erminea]|uniref:olfactory receptor 10A3-like isoform X2 n=1 Tax=Mustela erminea TaxID=36723 RepID=UPI001386C1FA|nr:olfactory receptor 10A3-like isoform X2 [Mustela erminea]